jgi:hypothetical protein
MQIVNGFQIGPPIHHWKVIEIYISKVGLHFSFGTVAKSYGQKKGQELNCHLHCG